MSRIENLESARDKQEAIYEEAANGSAQEQAARGAIRQIEAQIDEVLHSADRSAEWRYALELFRAADAVQERLELENPGATSWPKLASAPWIRR